MIARIDEYSCVGCGLCIDVCPADAIEVNDKAIVLNGKCIGCGACVEECPQDAICLVDSEEVKS